MGKGGAGPRHQALAARVNIHALMGPSHQHRAAGRAARPTSPSPAGVAAEGAVMVGEGSDSPESLQGACVGLAQMPRRSGHFPRNRPRLQTRILHLLHLTRPSPQAGRSPPYRAGVPAWNWACSAGLAASPDTDGVWKYPSQSRACGGGCENMTGSPWLALCVEKELSAPAAPPGVEKKTISLFPISPRSERSQRPPPTSSAHRCLPAPRPTACVSAFTAP